MLNTWLHLLALTGYAGSVVGLWFVLLPAASQIKDPNGKAKLLAHGLKLYNPIQIGALGILILSGAFGITDLKAVYRESFTRELGFTFGLKLILSFLLIILSVYQSMGIAHRFVRRYEDGVPVSAAELESLVRGLRTSIIPIVILTLLTALVGVMMRR